MSNVTSKVKPNALFLLANGFEELEFIAPFDILHRGGVAVKTAAITAKKEVTGAHGISMIADSLLQEIDSLPVNLPFDMLILPGGGTGTKNLLESEAVKNLIVKSYNAGKHIAAICAAPTVLAKAGIIANHVATSYPSVRADVEPCCKKYLDVPVVVSDNVITSRGAGTAAEFGFCLLSVLADFKTAEEVKKSMVF